MLGVCEFAGVGVGMFVYIVMLPCRAAFCGTGVCFVTVCIA